MDFARVAMWVLIFGVAVILLEKLSGTVTGSIKNKIPFA